MSSSVPFRVTDEGSKEAAARNLELDYDHVFTLRAGATPTVSRLTRFRAPGVVQTITNFEGGQQAQIIYIRGDDTTTVADNANIVRTGGSSVLALDRIYTFLYDNGVWYEIGAGEVLAARLSSTVPTALLNGIETQIVLDTVDYDEGGFGGVSDTLTIPFNGIYSIKACVAHEATAGAGLRAATIKRNGSEDIGFSTAAGSASIAAVMPVIAELELSAGDEITLHATQSSGGPIDALASQPTYPWMAISLVRLV